MSLLISWTPRSVISRRSFGPIMYSAPVSCDPVATGSPVVAVTMARTASTASPAILSILFMVGSFGRRLAWLKHDPTRRGVLMNGPG